MEPGFTTNNLLQLPGPAAEEERGWIRDMDLLTGDQFGVIATYVGKSTAIVWGGTRTNRHLKSFRQPFSELKSSYDRRQQLIQFHYRFAHE